MITSPRALRLAVAISVATLVHFSPATLAAEDNAPREIMWDALIPEDWTPPPPAGFDSFFDDDPTAPAASQSMPDAPVVTALDGQLVRLPGYIVPLTLDGEDLVEFLMVPYLGACIHVPPPPSNQIVHVTLKEPIKLETIYEPFWVTGTLRTSRVASQLATASYSMDGTGLQKYVY